MNLRMTRKNVYLATIVAVFSILGGFALAAGTLGAISASGQLFYTGTPEAVTGIVPPTMSIGMGTNCAATGTSSVSPQAIGNGAQDYCFAGVTLGDPVENVTFDYAPPAGATTFHVEISIATNAGQITGTVYFSSAGGQTSPVITIQTDLGSATSIGQVTVIFNSP